MGIHRAPSSLKNLQFLKLHLKRKKVGEKVERDILENGIKSV